MSFRLTLSYLCAAAALVTPAFAGNPLVVKTDSGKGAGQDECRRAGARFSRHPLRRAAPRASAFQAPTTGRQMAGHMPATSFGSRCYQQEIYDDMVFRDPGQSEDCLTLNVWAPAAKPKAKLPVMVWIYGGGFTGGGTSEPRQDGEHLTRKGVLVVSMNYRLGIFGFLATQQLAAEDPHHAAGNYGLMDELAALQWVKRNIANFGGDPNNVTIFGESAGSFAVSAQMASPLARGLFAHAIGESGGAFASKELAFPPLEEAAKTNEDFLRRAGVDPALTVLRAMSSEDVLKLGMKKDLGTVPFEPDTDGYFCPRASLRFSPPALRHAYLSSPVGTRTKAPEML